MISFNPPKPFDLPLLPPPDIFRSVEVYEILPEVRASLGELKGYAELLPNPMLLLSPAIIKESLASSNIENIHTTLEDVLQQTLFPEVERRPENKEVIRYREAALWGFGQLQKIPLSRRVIEGVQRRILPGKEGGFRRVQNRIANQTSGAILYTPPEPQHLDRLISNLEQYMHNEEERLDPLIRTAVSHYQFEAIHPFLDGNGRAGRILIVLQLIHHGILNLPVLYISGYINEQRDEYYRLLRRVSSDGEWIPFILYMLRAFHTQAKETHRVLFEIVKLYNEFRNELKENFPALSKTNLAEILFQSPIITPVRLGEAMQVHYTTASRHLNDLRNAGILRDMQSGKYHLYINHRLMGILR
jgi:Fic family protein